MARPVPVRKQQCLADLARARRMAAWVVSQLGEGDTLHLLAQGGAELSSHALQLVDVATDHGPAQPAQARSVKRAGRP
jgi:hypothetical protein